MREFWKSHSPPTPIHRSIGILSRCKRMLRLFSSATMTSTDDIHDVFLKFVGGPWWNGPRILYRKKSVRWSGGGHQYIYCVAFRGWQILSQIAMLLLRGTNTKSKGRGECGWGGPSNSSTHPIDIWSFVISQVDLPVFFYIDPDFANDSKMDDVHDIVLSYTFAAAANSDPWYSTPWFDHLRPAIFYSSRLLFHECTLLNVMFK